MKQNQKGITLVGLLITVIVIVTIAGVCIYTGRDLLEEAKLEQLKTNMLLIQAKCQSVGERVTAKELKDDEERDDHIGDPLTEEEYSIYGVTKNENDDWYKLSKDDIEERDTKEQDDKGNEFTKYRVGLGNIGVSDGDYLFNYTDNEVFYTPGYNGQHTLTQILETDTE